MADPRDLAEITEADLAPEHPVWHECAWCGEDFLDEPDVPYCSDACWRADR